MPIGFIAVRVSGADGQPFDAARNEILYTIVDGNNRQRFRDFRSAPDVDFSLPLANDLSDYFRLIVWADGYLQAGYESLHVQAGKTSEVHVMLVPKKARFDFTRASWGALESARPSLFAFLSSTELGNSDPRASYENLMANQPDALATLLNVCTAMDQIRLIDQPSRSPLNRLIAMNWICTNRWIGMMKPDRFFAYAELDLLRGIESTNVEIPKSFGYEKPLLHWCMDISYKETTFREANVQFSFATATAPPCTPIPDNCLIVDCDMDYYKDVGTHLLLEVLPNSFFGGRTDPRRTFVFRWMEARRMQIESPDLGIPPFDPPYLMVPM